MAYLDNNGVTYLWNKIKTLFNKGITNLSVSGRTITFTKGDGTTGTITTQDTNTTYGNFKGATASADGGSGLVPAPTKGNEGKYLKADGTWGTPTNTTYSDMKGATTTAAGTHGLAPAPAAGAANRYLRSDGTWSVPPDNNTTYNDATQSAHGLMTAADKKKLDGIATNANNYTHPTTSGNKHIPAGGSSGQILRWSAEMVQLFGARITIPLTVILKPPQVVTQRVLMDLYRHQRQDMRLWCYSGVAIGVAYKRGLTIPLRINAASGLRGMKVRRP